MQDEIVKSEYIELITLDRDIYLYAPNDLIECSILVGKITNLSITEKIRVIINNLVMFFVLKKEYENEKV